MVKTLLLNDTSHFSTKSINISSCCYTYYMIIHIIVIYEIHVLLNFKMNKGDVCLVDCATTQLF